MHPETPILLACLVGLIGVLGLVAAMTAANGVRDERKTLEKGIARFRASVPSINGGQLEISKWFNTEGLPENSHFGDCLKSVWSGRCAGRIPTLAELHNLAVRRERRRHPARLATGIIGLLVVSGIAGTLLSIHPILKKFETDTKANKDGTVEASIRTENAKEMIRGLGSAFYPSLTALIFTVIVASYRGGHYVRIASDLAWELDRFVIDELFPTFKLPALAEELRIVGDRLSTLIDGMTSRDAQFGVLVGSLAAFSKDLIAAGPSWKKAADAITKAADGLTVDARAVLKGLTAHLGSESPVVRALVSIESLGQDSKDAAGQFREASNTLANASDALTGMVNRTTAQVDQVVSTIPGRIEQGFAAGSKEIIETARMAAGETAEAIAKVGESTDGLATASAAISDSVDRNIRQLDGAIGTIPRRFEQVFADVGRELLEISHKAGNAAAAAITTAGKTETEKLRQAAAELCTTALENRNAAALDIGRASAYSGRIPVSSAPEGVLVDADRETTVERQARRAREAETEGEVEVARIRQESPPAPELTRRPVTTQPYSKRSAPQAELIVAPKKEPQKKGALRWLGEKMRILKEEE